LPKKINALLYKNGMNTLEDRAKKVYYSATNGRGEVGEELTTDFSDWLGLLPASWDWQKKA
jgi:hypothetical protein